MGEADKLSQEQLAEKRREHARAAAAVYDYAGSIEFFDEKRKVHRTVHLGPIADDGAGPTRAYNHCITGGSTASFSSAGLQGKRFTSKLIRYRACTVRGHWPSI
jgi:hypothetical protein